MATPYALRVHLVDPAVDAGVLAWIQAKSPGHLVVKHEADEDDPRPHWHALLWSEKKEQALRVDFKKANPGLVGNKGYSLTSIKKKTDEDPVQAYERYMCHGKHEGDSVVVVSAHGAHYTPQFFVEQNKLFYASRRTFRQKAEKKAQSTCVVNDLIKECQAAVVVSREEIARKLLSMYKRDRKPINVYHARNIVNAAWMILNGEEAEAELAREIAGRF